MEVELEASAAGGDAKARTKSPLVSSVERGSKCQRVDIGTPLPSLQPFPIMISEGNDSGEKGEKGKKGTKGGETKGRVRVKTLGPWGKEKTLGIRYMSPPLPQLVWIVLRPSSTKK